MSQHPIGMTKIINSFPEYKYVPKGEIDGNRHNMYRGVDVGFGGYVYSSPGIHYNVGLLDSASHHPTSIICMNYFGEYTKNFKDILDARILIKHRNFEDAKKLLDGKLAPYLDDVSLADDLAQALKIAVNSCYGLTAANFNNPMRHPANINNIVALRGALFMKLLQDEVNDKGYTVVSIRTDSIKIANIDDKIIDFIMDFGKKYGYTFEHEATYEKMCLVDKTNYIAKYDSKGIRNKGGKHAGEWTATGITFQRPYIFKSLFSHEQIEFKDLCETKEVKNLFNMYLDMNEDLGEDEHNYQFIGRVGLFCPIKPGANGGLLVKTKGEKYDAVTGTKGHRWLEAEVVKQLGLETEIDMSYFRKLVDDALDQISKFGDVEAFMSDDPVESYPDDVLPWCSKEDCNSCDIMHVCHDEALDYVSQNGGKDDKA